jgi:hypothetical protein
MQQQKYSNGPRDLTRPELSTSVCWCGNRAELSAIVPPFAYKVTVNTPPLRPLMVHIPVRSSAHRRGSRPQEWCLIRSPRDLDSGLYAVMAVMVTSSCVGFSFVILVRRLLARMSRPR